MPEPETAFRPATTPQASLDDDSDQSKIYIGANSISFSPVRLASANGRAGRPFRAPVPGYD